MVRVRRNAKHLTQEERDDLARAILQLKRIPSSYPCYELRLNAYDAFAYLYKYSFYDVTSNAHVGPAYLPWHREMLHRFDLELQRVDPEVVLPYWDWTDPECTDAVFSDDFMGGAGNPANGNAVEAGPFGQDSEFRINVYDGAD